MTQRTCTCPHCGCDFELRSGEENPRSVPQLRRFMGLVRATYLHWPLSHEFQPRSVRHLRYWLTDQAGWGEPEVTARIESADPQKVYDLLSAFVGKTVDDAVFLHLKGNRLTQTRVKSISFEAMGPKEFSELVHAVEAVIEGETGLIPQRLLEETRKAA